MVKITKNGLFNVDDKTELLSTDKIDNHVVLRCLYDACEIEDDVTLGDIFTMVESYMYLEIFIGEIARCPIQDFHAQAKEPVEIKDTKEKIDYLEIIQSAEVFDMSENDKREYFKKNGNVTGFNPEKSKFFDTNIDFGGVGPHPDRPGETIAYSVSYTPVNQLIHLPVKLNTSCRVLSQSVRGPCVELFTATRAYTLLDVLYAIYFDISFVGGPEDNKAFMADMKQRVEMIKDPNNLGTFDLE